MTAFALVLAACVNDDTTGTTEAEDTTSTTTATTSTTTSTTTTVAPTTTTTTESPSAELDATCASPEGFTVAYPDTWETNDGDVVAECTRFDPEDFAVPEGTIEREADGDGIVPEGTLVTSYYIDLGTDPGRVLIADTLDYTSIEYGRSQQVLDRMVTTLDIEADATSGVDPLGDFVAHPVESSGYPASGDPAFLTDVRFGVHDGFERVVLQFATTGDFSYSAEYVEEAVPASGDPIEVAGSHILDVTMTPASGVDLSGDQPEETYTGSDRIDVSGDLVTELAQVEDFENMFTWAIGTESTADISVSTLDDPHRLVIDMATD